MLTFVYLPTPLCQIRTLPKFSRQHYHVSIPKLPTQHNSARSTLPNCQLNITIFAKLPSPLHPCGLPKWASSCPQIKKISQGLNDFFWSAQNFAPENQTAPMCVCVCVCFFHRLLPRASHLFPSFSLFIGFFFALDGCLKLEMSLFKIHTNP
jgi:hypothetical protein